MSIDIREFDDRTQEELRELTNPERIIAFLSHRDDRAWKATEIAHRTDVNENSIHPVLSRLEERELVRHKGPYWAITADEARLRRADELHRATRLFDDVYGEEERDEWMQREESRDDS